MYQFGEGASCVFIHLEIKDGFVLWQIAEVGAVELFGEAVSWYLRDHQSLRHRLELVQEINYLPEGGFVGHRAVAVAAVFRGHCIQAVELAMMLLTFEAEYHFGNEVVDVEEFELHGGVVDRVWEVVGEGVAEGSDNTVVIRATPFAEEVREAVYLDGGACLPAVVEEEVFACLFASAVLAVAEASGEGGLLAAAEHHGTFVAVLLEGVEKGAGEAEVALHKFFLILGAVDSRKVEDEIGFLAILLQLFGGGVEVVFKDFTDIQITPIARLAIAYILEFEAEVPADETFCSCYENFHYFARLATPLSSFWMYSRLAILALVSSRLRRRVLLLLNSSMVTALTLPSLKNLS